ncbi:MAG: LLM class flavin-dependent oxidoreductase [Anaerolineae bacterium]|nr:LLM class flavin-dependent oxidoreductase [Anaerolineae bacterium]
MSVESGIQLAELVEVVKEAERLGYHRCWIPDEGIVHRDVFVALALAAEQTHSIQLGTGITNPYIRHPAITAAAIATIHELSSGRAFLGISAGGSVTLGPLGMTPVRPLQAVREMIDLSRSLLQGETVTAQGAFFTLNRASIPYAKKTVEIWLAARGNKMLKLGGELADGVLLGPMHKSFIGDYVQIVRDGARLTGNRPKLCYSVSIIQDEKAFNAFRSHMSFNIADSPPAIQEALGIPEKVLQEVRKSLRNDGPHEAGKLLRDEWVLPFMVSGSAAECKAEITEIMKRYRFDELRVTIPGPKPEIEELTKISDMLLDA